MRQFQSRLARFAVLLFVVAACAPTVEAEDPPRPLWHNTSLRGTPEPPAPYAVEPVFEQIEWKAPLYVAPVPNSNELVVVLQGGDADRPSQIVRLPNDASADHVEPVLSLDRRLIYGLTFHPDFAQNNYVYLFSNGPWNETERANRISRYTATSREPFTIDPASEQVVIEWRSAGHDGGDLAFGADRLLYIASGDGTGDSDTWDSGQDTSNLLGAILRIDVDRPTDERPYSIPPDNPFVDLAGARPEIWAYGLRNPWRLSVDPATGDLWVGNNGQDQWETAHLVRRAENFGWSVYEGSHPFYLHRRRGPTPIVPPTIEHPHSEFRSLTGGVVYRGEKLPELDGAYIYGDYSTGKIWGARGHRREAVVGDGQLTWSAELADTPLQIAAFRVDQRGELLVVDHGGGLYRLVPSTPEPDRPIFPTTLSDTGLFESVAEHRPAEGLIPYEVNAAGWHDGATAERLIALDGQSQIAFAASGGWNFDDGAVLVQTLMLALDASRPDVRRRIETRLLVRWQNEWAGYSYRWNDEQTDAALVPKVGADVELTARPAGDNADANAFRWRFPSRTECLTCHTRAANFVLGPSAAQINRDRDGENQLRRLERLGAFKEKLPTPPEDVAHLVDPYDASEPLDARARSYLHANCSDCHVAAGGGNARMELGFATAADAMQLIAARPQHDTFGIPDAMLVAPASPEHSVLLARLTRRGRGQMPPLVLSRVDERAVELFEAWIAQLKPARPFVRAWTVEELTPHLADVSEGHGKERGEALFREIGCRECHRLGGEGGSVGPDLSDLAQRQKPHEILESIVLPSQKIADAYAATQIETDDGQTYTGRIEHEDASSLTLRTGAGAADTVTIETEQIAGRGLSNISNMPEGIINVLELDEVLELLAYLTATPNNREKAGLD